MRIETTSIVTINASDRAKGIFPFTISDDFDLQQEPQSRKHYKEPVGIYWCNVDEVEKLQKLCDKAKQLRELRKQQMILETELFLSVVNEMCNV